MMRKFLPRFLSSGAPVAGTFVQSLRVFGGWALALSALFIAARLFVTRLVEPQWVVAVSGLYGDLLTAVVAAALLTLAFAWHRLLAFAWLALILILLCINLEYIYALDDVLRFGQAQFALDWKFIAGTLANLRTLPFVIFTVIASAVLWFTLGSPGRKPLTIAVAVAVLLASAPPLWHNAGGALSWRGANPIVMTAVRDIGRRQEIATDEVSAQASEFFRRDLTDGRFLQSLAELPGANDRPNILFIVIEGIPGAYLRQTQRATGYVPSISMPKLSAFADRALVVPNFVVHAPGTIRGTYAMFCGDYSSVRDGEGKGYIYTGLEEEERFSCLPEILADNGYQTSYLQSANLAYMAKDEFMPDVGFARVRSVARDEDDSGSFWGADDDNLYVAAQEEIKNLTAAGAPWMLTLLNVGTHHPYSAPEEYFARFSSRKEAAIAYLDDSLGEFLTTLVREGALDDTFVVIASDESHGLPGHELGGVWGTLLFAGPGIGASVNTGVFGQLDVALSVLDYLDLTAAGEYFLGRSAFRAYTEPRQIIFGDFMSTRPDEAITCFTDFCRSVRANNGMLFAPAYHAVATPIAQAAATRNLLREVRQRTDLFHGRGAHSHHLFAVYEQELAGDKEVSFQANVSLPAGHRIKIDLDMTNNGAIPVSYYWTWRNARGERLFKNFQPLLGALAPDMRLEQEFHFKNPDDEDWIIVLIAVNSRGRINTVINHLVVNSEPIADEEEDDFQAPIFARVFSSAEFSDNWMFPDGGDIFFNVRRPVHADILPYLQSDYLLTERGFFPAARYRLGEKIKLGSDGPWYGNLYLGADWSYPKPAGISSDGELPVLSFYLDDLDAESVEKYELLLEFTPYVHAELVPEQKIGFYLNDVKLGERAYTEREASRIGIELPPHLFKPNAVNTISFEIGTPFSPKRYNAGVEFEKLGIDLREFTIVPKRSSTAQSAGENP